MLFTADLGSVQRNYFETSFKKQKKSISMIKDFKRFKKEDDDGFIILVKMR